MCCFRFHIISRIIVSYCLLVFCTIILIFVHLCSKLVIFYSNLFLGCELIAIVCMLICSFLFTCIIFHLCILFHVCNFDFFILLHRDSNFNVLIDIGLLVFISSESTNAF
ncbi:hypothetical protein V6Z11_A03G164300 [Gossypium hirsutum]